MSPSIEDSLDSDDSDDSDELVFSEDSDVLVDSDEPLLSLEVELSLDEVLSMLSIDDSLLDSLKLLPLCGSAPQLAKRNNDDKAINIFFIFITL